MQLINYNGRAKELPLQVLFSIEPLVPEIEQWKKNKNHPLHQTGKQLWQKIKEYPALRTGIDDITTLPQYDKVLDLLFTPLFLNSLQQKDIKAIVLPYIYVAFYLTGQFQEILAAAGNDFKLQLRGFNLDSVYKYACVFILRKYYGRTIVNLDPPVFMDIPNEKTGRLRHFRVHFNSDFIEVLKTDKAPQLTPADIDKLIQNGDNIALWKAKFPPNSYQFKGFEIINLFDSTQDEVIAHTRALFLRRDDAVYDEFKKGIRELFMLPDLQIGIGVYDTHTKKTTGTYFQENTRSLFWQPKEVVDYPTFFADTNWMEAMENSQIFAIPDVDVYAHQKITPFARRLQEKGFKSLILIPMKIEGVVLQEVIELGSTRKNELNDISSERLNEIIPFMRIAAERFTKENQAFLESTIQEHFTSIHPTVKWRFVQAVTNWNIQKSEGVANPVMEEIAFPRVYPLYGQSDIVGSSKARNEAVQKDLVIQLNMVIQTFKQVQQYQDIAIYKNLIFRVNQHLSGLQDGLQAGEESSILEFLQQDIYPVFNYISTIHPDIKTAVAAYTNQIDEKLKVIYQYRKDYEASVTMLNDKMIAFLDEKQAEAQAIFPHYFERYKTDGVEYNIYIGQSLVDRQTFDLVHLHNLRLWQLEVMCQMERLAYDLVKELPSPLRVASLILCHSSTLDIKFRMGEKQFDVDGAYNVRYEIIKKRIDKSLIKGTNERLTVAGKIAIVYAQEKDAQEYLNYIQYLQSKNYLGEMERLELEEMQGVSGLKALRVAVNYEGLNGITNKHPNVTQGSVKKVR